MSDLRWYALAAFALMAAATLLYLAHREPTRIPARYLEDDDGAVTWA